LRFHFGAFKWNGPDYVLDSLDDIDVNTFRLENLPCFLGTDIIIPAVELLVGNVMKKCTKLYDLQIDFSAKILLVCSNFISQIEDSLDMIEIMPAFSMS
jgi:hypothetical protein